MNDPAAAVAKVPVLVEGDTVWIGGCAPDTMRTVLLEVDGRAVDPNSEEGMKVLEEMGSGSAEEVWTDAQNMDRLVLKMNDALKAKLASDSARTAFDRETLWWSKARDKRCGVVDDERPLNDQMEIISCRHWITGCRIDDMPALYGHWVHGK